MTWLYLPNGCKWEFTRELLNEADAEWAAEHDYAAALLYTNRLLALGASVNAPGLEDGEQKEQVGYVVYRSKVNDDATETPIIDLYLNHDATKFKFLTVYLNSPDDVATFENTSGLLLSGLPYWEGGHLERGNPKTDKYFIAPRKPLTVVHKLNERYNPDEPDMTKRKPKRLFVRWESAGTPTPAPQPAAAQPPANPFAGQQPPASNEATALQWELKPGDPAWFRTPVRDCWTVAKNYIQQNIYSGNIHEMTNSFAKRGVTIVDANGKMLISPDWQLRHAGELVDMLLHRHDEKATA